MVANRYPRSELLAAGWSLGGNILVRYLGEEGENSRISAAASLCNTLDLVRPHCSAANKPTGFMLSLRCTTWAVQCMHALQSCLLSCSQCHKALDSLKAIVLCCCVSFDLFSCLKCYMLLAVPL